MTRVVINLRALRHNLNTVDKWMQGSGAQWTLVTKVLCGHEATLRALHNTGVQSMGESRLENLRAIRSIAPEVETWYLRVPALASISDVIDLATVTLNTEDETIHALNEEAKRRGRIHRIIIMIELGDLREGILPGSLINFYNHIFQLDHIDVLGIGANLGCLAGAVPNVDQYMQLIMYRELLELKFGQKLPFISAGTSATLPLVLDGQLPEAVNHFRIGEAVFLGTDLVNGGLLPELRNDVFTLEAEITEIKRKSLFSDVETAEIGPFKKEYAEEFRPGQRGYRALVNVGELDTEVSGLIPENPNFHIAGASSDVSVVNVGDSPGGLSVGDVMCFRMTYSALVRIMANKYVDVDVEPSLKEYIALQDDEPEIPILPVLDCSETINEPGPK
ncbi:MAG: alanine racemase [Candidatus Eisenbacteria bacterium]|uniref:Alanine racemase n=1 Tax=Eiseniibacteriota bacterium TaxID=2212470 RepID=A0A948W5S8_UNCEI|nr:alanine racemase [Candidatus Eisenbacteria bacterium]MBU1948063.1 alanine racemase [Candidatus Eisenbacteria bacterium]MBU2689876.1 alanine racemase [Candidatus Eisenbacteria bacterium]